MTQAHYRRDLAAVHHSGFGWAAEGASKTVLKELARRRLRSGLVVDLGSGSGILAERVSAAGYDVLGIEQSAEMIRIAKKQAPDATFVRGSVVDQAIPRCVAVTAIGEVLNYRFDPRVSLKTIKLTFKRVHDALESGGLFLFDLSGPGRGGPAGVIEKLVDAETYSIFIRAREEKQRRLLVRDHIVFIRSGERYRRVDESHVLYLVAPDRAEALLQEVGFDVQRLDGYPGGPEIAGWQVFLATKPKA